VIKGFRRFEAIDLQPEDFTDVFCRELWKVLGNLSSRGIMPDLVTLMDALGNDAGKIGQVIDICKCCLTDTWLDQHIANVRGATQKRRLARVLQESLDSVGNETAAEIAERIFRESGTILREEKDDGLESLQDAMLSSYTMLNKQNDEAVIPTGISTLDRLLTGGFRGGKLVVIGARTSVGKSALGLSIASSAAKAGKRVLYVTLEMTSEEICIRLFSRMTGIPGDVIEGGKLEQEQYDALAEAIRKLTPQKIVFSKRTNTPARIRTAAERMKESEGLDLIVVDNLQLMSSGKEALSRLEEIGAISRELKLLSIDLNIPVVAMTQLNRASEIGEGKMPRMSEAGDGRSIEMNADIFIILHRPKRETVFAGDEKIYDLCRRRGGELLYIDIQKNQGGRLGTVRTLFLGSGMRFLPIVMHQP
jgi:replicative DNA helicase